MFLHNVSHRGIIFAQSHVTCSPVAVKHCVDSIRKSINLKCFGVERDCSMVLGDVNDSKKVKKIRRKQRVKGVLTSVKRDEGVVIKRYFLCTSERIK